MDFDKFLEVLRALAHEGVDYVLVGGVALGVHGIARATEDIDLFIRADEQNVERLKRALRSVWDDPDIGGITAGDLAGEYPTIRYGPPGEGFVIDLLGHLVRLSNIRYGSFISNVRYVKDVDVGTGETSRDLRDVMAELPYVVDRVWNLNRALNQHGRSP